MHDHIIQSEQVFFATRSASERIRFETILEKCQLSILERASCFGDAIDHICREMCMLAKRSC